MATIRNRPSRGTTLGSSDAEAIRVRLVLDPKEYETYESGDKKVVVK